MIFDLFEQFDLNNKTIAYCITLIAVIVLHGCVARVSHIFSIRNVLSNFIVNAHREVAAKYNNFLNYFIILQSFFFAILIFNILSLFSYILPITALMAVAAAVSASVFLSVILAAITKFGIFFLSNFYVSGLNTAISTILAVIEAISNAAKVFSLAIRLFANIFAGHVLVKVFLALATLFIVNSVTSASTGLVFIVLAAVYCLELFVSILQACIVVYLLLLYSTEFLVLN